LNRTKSSDHAGRREFKTQTKVDDIDPSLTVAADRRIAHLLPNSHAIHACMLDQLMLTPRGIRAIFCPDPKEGPCAGASQSKGASFAFRSLAGSTRLLKEEKIMSSQDRRAAARRRAWGRGPTILRFEPLEDRQMLSITTPNTTPADKPDLVATAFDTLHNLDWGDSFHAVGAIQNEGTAATTVPFNVNVYASTSQIIDANSVYVGTVTIPAGLQPGTSTNFDQVMNAPASPIPSLGSTPLYYLDLKVDPSNATGGADTINDQGLVTSAVTVTPHQPANLVGNGFSVTPSPTTWGQTISVNAQLLNDGAGNAPATRARVVLTPAGQLPGGPNDVTIGSLSVPALGAFQTAGVSGKIVLPATAPSSLASGDQFTIAMIPDADFLTKPFLSIPNIQGIGADAATIQIDPAPGSTTSSQALPDLSVASVQLPSTTLTWGSPFVVNATVQNTGKADAGSFQVRFLLVDANRPNAFPLALGTATIPSLKAGFSQAIAQTMNLQGALPDGVSLGSISGRIIVQVDPENSVDESSKSNNGFVTGAVSLVAPTPPTTTTTTTTTTGSTSQGSSSNSGSSGSTSTAGSTTATTGGTGSSTSTTSTTGTGSTTTSSSSSSTTTTGSTSTTTSGSTSTTTSGSTTTTSSPAGSTSGASGSGNTTGSTTTNTQNATSSSQTTTASPGTGTTQATVAATRAAYVASLQQRAAAARAQRLQRLMLARANAHRPRLRVFPATHPTRRAK
jgi:hypothetical protein